MLESTHLGACTGNTRLALIPMSNAELINGTRKNRPLWKSTRRNCRVAGDAYKQEQDTFIMRLIEALIGSEQRLAL